MEVSYQYTKRRSDFGKHCVFQHGETQVLDFLLSTKEHDDKYHTRNPVVTGVDTNPYLTESEMNTDRVIMANTSLYHSEGGWPKDVDSTDQSDVNRFRKKVEKDSNFQSSIRSLGAVAERCMRQNNTVNVYENFFEGLNVDHTSEPPSMKGLAVFRDPSDIKRTATSIDWHPDRNGKFAVSYSVVSFQDPRLTEGHLPTSSYIWDIQNPNSPSIELLPPSPLCSLKYNPKSTDTLVGGCYNGLITYFDLRKPNAPTNQCMPLATSLVEHSHHDPVYDVFWISSKTGHQCTSVSTDGQMKWWDTRNLNAPTDTIKLIPDLKNVECMSLGGCSMEYNSEAGPTKYLIGSEQGQVASINLRNRKTNNGLSMFDVGPGQHHGPIYSIQRNPIHSKYFLTVGDWTAKIWTDDIKSPILSTKYHNSYLTSGCWSPTRAGVFFVTREDGVLDVWDFFYKQNDVVYSRKLGDASLSSIALHSDGKYAAIGDINGTVSLLELCDSLSTAQPKEKVTINTMFERETRREKNLEVREREVRRAKTLEEEYYKKQAENKNQQETYMKEETEILKRIEEEFSALVKEKEAVSDGNT